MYMPSWKKDGGRGKLTARYVKRQLVRVTRLLMYARLVTFPGIMFEK